MVARTYPLFLLLLILIISVAGCRTGAVITYPGSHPNTGAKTMPPGQAKKLYGHHSARAFAPGQQKKRGTVIVVQPQGKGQVKKKGKKKK